MTDRVNGVYVSFDKDYRTDDVQSIIDAIKMIKGVLDVEINVTNMTDWMNRSKIASEYQDAIYDTLSRLRKNDVFK